jgi:hypothetical protein
MALDNGETGMALIPGELFKVWIFFPDGTYMPEGDWQPVEEAIKQAKRSIQKPAAMLGMITKVMITDQGDLCCFLWEYGKGTVFPPMEKKDG